jgi:chemotaxis protein MotB
MAGKGADHEEGLPEWIMSYADMITILMAFFVVMYSMASGKDNKKEQAVMRSLREQFGASWPGMAALGPPYVNKNSALAKMSGSSGGDKTKSGKGAVQRSPLGDHPRIQTLRPGEQAAIGGVIRFPDGVSTLGEPQRKQLQIAASEIGGKPQRIEIRGHTSRRPVARGAPYRDNWDLAYTRCRNVMDYLLSLGIDPKRIRLGVAADNEPAPGESDVLARNSRVEVFMLNELVNPLTPTEKTTDAPLTPAPPAPAPPAEE